MSNINGEPTVCTRGMLFFHKRLFSEVKYMTHFLGSTDKAKSIYAGQCYFTFEILRQKTLQNNGIRFSGTHFFPETSI